MGKSENGVAVEFRERLPLRERRLLEGAVGRGSGVIDEELVVLLAQALSDGFDALLGREIGDDVGVVTRGETREEILEARFVARNEGEGVALAGEVRRETLTYSFAGAGDEGGHGGLGGFLERL